MRSRYNARQGRFNSNYKGGVPTVNILAAWEWQEVLSCKEEEIEALVKKYDQQYRCGTYPSKLDVPAMIEKIKAKRNEQAN